jgi:hypothetical protein
MQVLKYVTVGLTLLFCMGCGEAEVTPSASVSQKGANASATSSERSEGEPGHEERAGEPEQKDTGKGLGRLSELDLPSASADSWEARMKVLDDAVSRARTLSEAGKAQAARDIVREVLMEDPGHPDAMDMAQDIGLMEKESDNKIDAIDELIKGGQVSLGVLRLHGLREDPSLAGPAKKMRLESTTKFWLVIVVDGGGLGKVGYAHRRWMRPFQSSE